MVLLVFDFISLLLLLSLLCSEFALFAFGLVLWFFWVGLALFLFDLFLFLDGG